MKSDSSKASVFLNQSPPIAPQRPRKMRKHGDLRVDNYYWLREKSNPEVVRYIRAENRYCEKTLSPTKKLQSKLVKEMRGRILETDQSTPYRKGDYYYFTQYKKGAEYPIYKRRKGSPSGPTQTLLDVNIEAHKKKFFDVSRLVVSPDQKVLAYAVDTIGRRLYELRFLNIQTGKHHKFIIPNTTGGMVWLNDNVTLLYTKQDPVTLRSHQVYACAINQKPRLIYEEKDPQFFVSVSKDLSQNYVYIQSHSNNSTEVQVANASDKKPKFKIFLKREKAHEYSILDGEDRFFIVSNDKAKNFRILETPKNKWAKKNWTVVVPHRNDTLIEDVLVFKDFVVSQERKNGLDQLVWQKRGQKARSRITFPEETYSAQLGPNANYDAKTFRYSYESLTQPPTIFDFDFKLKKSKLIRARKVPTFNPKLYESKRIYATAYDKVKVPVSLVYKKSKFKKGKNPLFVYAYGSYGLSTDSYFRSHIVSLLDRGFVFAIAHIRGGSDLGRAWYESGKLLKKKNTFKDFISATEHLLAKGYGQANHVYAMGGSAGGLLMGAVINMRPDLYNGVVAAVPFVDVVTTMLDDSIPLTTNEYKEWGDPNNPKFYKYMKSYSPYDNVIGQKYPNILVTTGFHDSQVQYWEPTKWVAKLRQHNTSKNVILFKTDMDAGHSGTTGRFKSLNDDALDYAFILGLEGF